jgi:hypothetical protein
MESQHASEGGKPHKQRLKKSNFPRKLEVIQNAFTEPNKVHRFVVAMDEYLWDRGPNETNGTINLP